MSTPEFAGTGTSMAGPQEVILLKPEEQLLVGGGEGGAQGAQEAASGETKALSSPGGGHKAICLRIADKAVCLFGVVSYIHVLFYNENSK